MFPRTLTRSQWRELWRLYRQRDYFRLSFINLAAMHYFTGEPHSHKPA